MVDGDASSQLYREFAALGLRPRAAAARRGDEQSGFCVSTASTICAKDQQMEVRLSRETGLHAAPRLVPGQSDNRRIRSERIGLCGNKVRYKVLSRTSSNCRRASSKARTADCRRESARRS
jgi:hypothetical protein